MQKLSKEADFQLLIINEYERDLIQLENMSTSVHYRGVKRTCKVNELKYFHAINNWIKDCFQNLFEGSIPCVTGSVLHSTSKTNPNLTVG